MNIIRKTFFERAAEPIANIGHKSVLDRATGPFHDSKREEWVRKGLATTAGFVAVSVASAITGVYRRKREGGG